MLFFVLYTFLPNIGVMSYKNLRGQHALTDESKEIYKNISYEFIAIFVGFIDGDGYIRYNKTSKGYINLDLVIGLSIIDKPLLEEFKSILKVGRIITDEKSKSKIAYYIISKVYLQQVIFPLIKHHNLYFLTKTRRIQHSVALSICEQGLIKYSDVKLFPEYLDNIPALPKTSIEYINLPFFLN
jgi:hypothetical protein